VHRYPPLFIFLIVLLAACQEQPLTGSAATLAAAWVATASASAATATSLRLTALAPIVLPRPTVTPGPSTGPTLPSPASQVWEMPGGSDVSLTVEPRNPKPGDPLTITWSIAATSYLAGRHHCLVINEFWEGSTYSLSGKKCTLPDAGSLTVSIPMANRDRFAITIDDSGAGVGVRLPCPDPYFWDVSAAPDSGGKSMAQNNCAASPPVSYEAVDQVFEGGRMLAVDNQVFVFDASSGGRERTTVFHAGATYTTSAEPLAASAGKYPPDPAAFEKVWRDGYIWNSTTSTVREALGWALAPAQAFQAVSQRPWLTGLGPGEDGTWHNWGKPDPDYQYVRLSDGRVIFVSLYARHGSTPSWEVIGP
jgi:hypothetical protein